MTVPDEKKTVRAEVVEENLEYLAELGKYKARQKIATNLLLAIFVVLFVVPAVYGVLEAARPYERPPLIKAGCAGFGLGALLGAGVSMWKRERWWASPRWVVYGIVGLLAFVVVHVDLWWPHFKCS